MSFGIKRVRAVAIGKRHPYADQEWRDFQDGFISGLHGVDPRLCPYPKLTAEWRTWQKWHIWGTELALEIERIENEGDQWSEQTG